MSACATALTLACAGGPSATPPAEGPSPDPATPEDAAVTTPVARPDEAMTRLDSLAAVPSAGRRIRAADSLFFRWRAEPSLRAAAGEALWVEARALDEAGRPVEAADRLEELLEVAPSDGARARRAATELARISSRIGREPDALRVLARMPEAGGDARSERIREAAAGMSAAELARAQELFPEGSADHGTVAAERARALALGGRRDSARAAARRALEGELPEPDRKTARAVIEGGVPTADADRVPPRIGLVLPLSGDLGSVGQLLREAATLAAGLDSVELVIRDDSSRASTVPRLVRDLERQGVTAIVGPVTSDGFRAALEARTDPSLPVVSPAASSAPPPAPNAYTLWEREARLRDLSRTLASWVPSETGLRKLSLLREASAAGRAYEHGFRSGARRAGGWVAAAGSFESDSTTFSGPVSWLAANRPQSLLVGTADTRTVLQMAPQLSYYGLRSALVAGTSAWGQPITVRRLSRGFPSRWITAVFADRTGQNSAWSRFESAYERQFRKGLPSGPLPALAYDATRWAAASLSELRLPRRGVVARGLARGSFDGASGTFAARPGASTVDREVRVLMASGGELHAPDTAAIQAWKGRADRLVNAGRRQRRQEARNRVQQWIAEHGDSVRVDSTRIRRRQQRYPELDTIRPIPGDTVSADTADAGGREDRDWLDEEVDDR